MLERQGIKQMKDLINNYSLKLQDKTINSLFNKYQIDLQAGFTVLFSKLIFFYSIFCLIVNLILQYKNVLNWITYSLSLIFSIVNIVINKKFPKTSYWITNLFIFTIFALVLANILIKTQCSFNQTLLDVRRYASLMILILNYISNWIVKLVLIVGAMVILQVLGYDYFLEQQNINALFFEASLLLILYMKDKNEKQQFTQFHFKYQQLSLQQNFIDKLIPSSMIILSKEGLQQSLQSYLTKNSLNYYNKQTLNGINLDNQSQNGSKYLQQNNNQNKKCSGFENNSSIISWDEIKIEYANQKCTELFKTSDLSEIKHKLQIINTYEKMAERSMNFQENQVNQSLLEDIIQELISGQCQLKSDLFKQNIELKNQEAKNNCQNQEFEIFDVMESKKHFIIDAQLFRAKYAICIWSKKPCILVLFLNESLQKKNNHLQQLNQYKDRLLATVSHDLKTPLNCIISVTDFLKTNLQQEMQGLTECSSQIQNQFDANGSTKYLNQSDINGSSIRYPNQLSLFSQKNQKNQNILDSKFDILNSNCLYNQESNLIKEQIQNSRISNINTNQNQQKKQSLEYLQLIYNNSMMLLSMINDILDYSKFNNKIKIKPNVSSFLLSDVIQEVYDIFSFQVQSKQVKLLLDTNVNITLSTDRNRVKQILMNLVSNSLKFTIQGFIKISAIENSEQNLVGISVEDTGIGMSEKIKKQLFKDYQTFNQENLNQNGIGLGLTICKKFVEMLGNGTGFQVDSAEGQGSKFYFEILKNYTHDSDKNQFDIYHYIKNEFGMESPVKLIQKPRALNPSLATVNCQKNNCQLVSNIQDQFNSNQNQCNININSILSQQQNFELSKLIDQQIISPTPSSQDWNFNQSNKKGSSLVNNLQKQSSNYEQEDDIPTELAQIDCSSLSQAIMQRNIIQHKNDMQQIFKNSHQCREVKKQRKKQVNIMIVDDSQYNLITLKLHLNPIKCVNVDEFLFAEEALKSFLYKDYDIVFSDVQMPIMDGIQFAKKIREKGQSIHQPLIIMVSADTQEKYDNDLLGLSISAFINKPIIDKSKFQSMIYSLIDQL
ncbi:hypothetical protein ABPG74_004355 [Tetrahymena malaccensis]